MSLKLKWFSAGTGGFTARHLRWREKSQRWLEEGTALFSMALRGWLSFKLLHTQCVWPVLSHVCYQLPCMWESPRRRSDIMLCVKLDTGRAWLGKWGICWKKAGRMETDKAWSVRPASTLCTGSVFIREFYIYTGKKAGFCACKLFQRLD